jgi:urea transport system permease protein
MRRLLLSLAAAILLALPGTARADLAAALAQYGGDIAQPSRQTIGPVIAALVETGDPAVARLLSAWGDRNLGQRKTDGAFFILTETADGYDLTDPLTGVSAGSEPKSAITQLRPNAGVRGLIAAALVQFQLSDPDPAQRSAALTAIAREPDAGQLAALRAALEDPDPALAAQKARLERLLTIRFDADSAARVAAINSFGADLGLDLRAALNPLVATRRIAATEPPADANIARELDAGTDLTQDEAFALLVAQGDAPAPLTTAEQREALAANIEGGTVGGVPLAQLSDQSARDRAYTALEAAGRVPVAATADEVAANLATFRFFDVYTEPDAAVTTAAQAALDGIATTLGLMQAADLGAGCAVAGLDLLPRRRRPGHHLRRDARDQHGAWRIHHDGRLYRLCRPAPDPRLHPVHPRGAALAFAVTFAAGVAMERLVIRHLYNRPLETLLATFGISIALQQIAKNIFGTQARPLTAPAWLDGAWVVNDIVSISYIRIAIFVLALMFLATFLFIMKRTRLGLEVRAVTQNPSMAASMGIDPDRINMLTFGWAPASRALRAWRSACSPRSPRNWATTTSCKAS